MLLGFAITRHCNLRCAHCIRDDVTRLRSLEPELLGRITDEALDLFGRVQVSLTGGEPLIHPAFEEIVSALDERHVQWRLTTNGWHFRRLLPVLDRFRPQSVRVSLSGGSKLTHDAERGRGSFRRVLETVALCTSRRIPTYFSLVIDRRDRHEITAAADLAEQLGINGLSFILPQPVPRSAARDSDLPPAEWGRVRDAVWALAAQRPGRTRIKLDYGYPFDGPERLCDTLRLEQIYVDPEGRICSCCQLSEYGGNETEVIADLHEVPLRRGWDLYRDHIENQRREIGTAVLGEGEFESFPCLRCAVAHGKMRWLALYPESPWNGAVKRPDCAQTRRTLQVMKQTA